MITIVAAIVSVYLVTKMTGWHKGTIVAKKVKELHVDLDGDKNVDCVLCFPGKYSIDNEFYYYAQPGDKVVYFSTENQSVLTIEQRGNRVCKVNGKDFSAICDWNKLNRHAPQKVR